MALTVSILTDAGEPDPELTLTLDAPRVVIGRSRSCEVLLPDSTVSQRHASIQQRGGENVIIDEGSTNGILVGTERLPARTPYPLREREIVRAGRVWLEICTGLGMPSEPRQAEVVAREWLTRRLQDEGEPARPVIRVVEGPDAGASLELAETERDYIIGRSKQSDLPLTGDGRLSRRHLSVRHEGAAWLVRDLDSKRGAELDGEPLPADAAVPWPSGATVALGDTQLELCDPLPEALSEALSGPDERMRSSEFAETPPGQSAEAAAGAGAAGDELGDDAEEEETAAYADGAEPDERVAEEELAEYDDAAASGAGVSARLIETVVVLVALAVLGASVAGLVWLLGP